MADNNDQDRQVSLEEWEKIAFEQAGVPEGLRMSIFGQESAGGKKLTSPTGVRGRYQLTQDTATRIGKIVRGKPFNRDDPWEQAAGAAHLLRHEYDNISKSHPHFSDRERWLGAAAKYYYGDGAFDQDGNLSTGSKDKLSTPRAYATGIAERWGAWEKGQSQQPAAPRPAAPSQPQATVPQTRPPKVTSRGPVQPRAPQQMQGPNPFSFQAPTGFQQAGQGAAQAIGRISPEVRQQADATAQRMDQRRAEYNQKGFVGQRIEDIGQGLANVGQSAQQGFENLLTITGARKGISKLSPAAGAALQQGQQAQAYTAQQMAERQKAADSMAARTTRGLTTGAAGATIMAPIAMVGGVPAVMGATGIQQDWANDPAGAAINTATAALPIAAGRMVSPVAARIAGNTATSALGQEVVRRGIEAGAGGATNAAQYAGTQALLGREIDTEEAISQGITGGVLGTVMAPNRQQAAQMARGPMPATSRGVQTAGPGVASYRRNPVQFGQRPGGRPLQEAVAAADQIRAERLPRTPADAPGIAPLTQEMTPQRAPSARNALRLEADDAKNLMSRFEAEGNVEQAWAEADAAHRALVRLRRQMGNAKTPEDVSNLAQLDREISYADRRRKEYQAQLAPVARQQAKAAREARLMQENAPTADVPTQGIESRRPSEVLPTQRITEEIPRNSAKLSMQADQQRAPGVTPSDSTPAAQNTLDRPAAGRRVRVGNEEVDLTPEQAARWAEEVERPTQEAEARYARARQSVNAAVRNAAESRRRADAMRIAAKKREIADRLTGKEQAAADRRAPIAQPPAPRIPTGPVQEPTNRITSTEYEGGVMNRYSRPLEGAPIETPDPVTAETQPPGVSARPTKRMTVRDYAETVDMPVEDKTALDRALRNEQAENPRAYDDVTRPGEPGSGGVSFSPYNDLVSNNRAKVNQLFSMDLNSPEATQIIADLEGFAANRNIEPRHVENLLNYIKNDQIESARRADGGDDIQPPTGPLAPDDPRLNPPTEGLTPRPKTEGPQADFYRNIESQESTTDPRKVVVDWGSNRGQGKRVGGMVRGSMADPPRGKKTYSDRLGKYSEAMSREDRTELALTEEQYIGHPVMDLYVQARNAGHNHDVAMAYVYEKIDPKVTPGRAYEYAQELAAAQSESKAPPPAAETRPRAESAEGLTPRPKVAQETAAPAPVQRGATESAAMPQEPLPNDSYTQARKRPDGKWQLFYLGTRNEVFPGEIFQSSGDARGYLRAMRAKRAEATSAETAAPIPAGGGKTARPATADLNAAMQPETGPTVQEIRAQERARIAKLTPDELEAALSEVEGRRNAAIREGSTEAQLADLNDQVRLHRARRAELVKAKQLPPLNKKQPPRAPRPVAKEAGPVRSPLDQDVTVLDDETLNKRIRDAERILNVPDLDPARREKVQDFLERAQAEKGKRGAKEEGAKEARAVNFTQFATEKGAPSDYDVLNHGLLGPSGRMSQRTKSREVDAQLDRATQNAKAKEEFRAAIERGEIVDAEGKITQKGIAREKQESAIADARSKIASLDQQIQTIEGLGRMSHLPNGKLKAAYQRTVDDYIKQKEAILADYPDLVKESPAPKPSPETPQGETVKAAPGEAKPKAMPEMPTFTRETNKDFARDIARNESNARTQQATIGQDLRRLQGLRNRTKMGSPKRREYDEQISALSARQREITSRVEQLTADNQRFAAEDAVDAAKTDIDRAAALMRLAKLRGDDELMQAARARLVAEIEAESGGRVTGKTAEDIASIYDSSKFKGLPPKEYIEQEIRSQDYKADLKAAREQGLKDLDAIEGLDEDRRQAYRQAIEKDPYTPADIPRVIESARSELATAAAADAAYGKIAKDAKVPSADAVEASAKGKLNKDTGLSDLQETYLIESLKENLPTLGRSKAVTIKVPGDGQFKVSDPVQANSLAIRMTGKPLTDEFPKIAKKVQQLSPGGREAQALRDYKPSAPKRTPLSPELAKEVVDNSPELTKPQFVADAEARLKDAASGNLAGSGARQFADVAIVTGYKAYKAGMKFAEWSKAVIKEAGEDVRPHLRAAWDKITSMRGRDADPAETGGRVKDVLRRVDEIQGKIEKLGDFYEEGDAQYSRGKQRLDAQANKLIAPLYKELTAQRDRVRANIDRVTESIAALDDRLMDAPKEKAVRLREQMKAAEGRQAQLTRIDDRIGKQIADLEERVSYDESPEIARALARYDAAIRANDLKAIERTGAEVSRLEDAARAKALGLDQGFSVGRQKNERPGQVMGMGFGGLQGGNGKKKEAPKPIDSRGTKALEAEFLARGSKPLTPPAAPKAPATPGPRSTQSLDPYRVKAADLGAKPEARAPIAARMKAAESRTPKPQPRPRAKSDEPIDTTAHKDDPGFWSKLSTLRKAGLLTSPKTHIVNMLGNSAYQVADEISRMPAFVADIVADAAHRVVTGKGQRSIAGANPLAVARAGFTGGKKGVAEARKIFKNGLPEDAAEKLQLQKVEFKNPILRAYTDFVFNSLGAEDQFFKNVAMQRSLESQAKVQALNDVRAGEISRGQVGARTKHYIENPTSEMAATAIADAEVLTFQNENKLSSAIRGGRGQLGEFGNFALDLVLPFDRTPTNIIARTLEMSPVGYVKNARQLVKAAMDKSFTVEQQREFSRTFGRASTGTGLIYLGYVLAANGLMTGLADPDPKKRAKEAAKAPPAAIKLGDRYYEIGKFAPAGALMGVGATIHRDLAQKPDAGVADRAASVGSGLGQVALDLPLLRAAKEVTEDVTRPQTIPGKAGRMVGSFVPSIVSDIGGLTDSYQRESKTFMGGVGSRIPGVRNRLEPRKTSAGTPIKTEWSDAIDPFRSRAVHQTDAGFERKLTDLEITVEKPDRKNGEPDDLYNARVARTEKWLQEYGERLTSDSQFRGLSEADQKRAIKSLRARVSSQANQIHPNVRSFEPGMILRSLREGERRQERGRAKLIYSPEPE